MRLAPASISATVLLANFSAHAVRPSEPCEAILNASRPYVGVIASDENADIALRTLRKFRFDLGYPTVQAALTRPLHLRASEATEKQRLQLAQQIEGIEAFLQGEQATGEGRKRWVFALEGTNVSKNFLDSLKREELSIQKAIAKDINITLSKGKRLGSAFLAAMVLASNFTYIPIWSELFSGPIATALSTALWFTTEPLALLSYYRHRDPEYKEIQSSLESFGAKLSGLALNEHRNAAQSLPWHFDSWAYRVTTFIPEYLLQGSSEHVDDAIAVQDLHDSRGTLFKLYRPLELARGERKGLISRTQREMEKEVWVYFDLLQTVNVETGEPLLLVSIRSSKERHPAFSAAPEAAKEKVPLGKLAPDLNYNP